MSAKRAFRPETFDRLESREVLAAFGFGFAMPAFSFSPPSFPAQITPSFNFGASNPYNQFGFGATMGLGTTPGQFGGFPSNPPAGMSIPGGPGFGFGSTPATTFGAGSTGFGSTTMGLGVTPGQFGGFSSNPPAGMNIPGGPGFGLGNSTSFASPSAFSPFFTTVNPPLFNGNVGGTLVTLNGFGNSLGQSTTMTPSNFGFGNGGLFNGNVGGTLVTLNGFGNSLGQSTTMTPSNFGFGHGLVDGSFGGVFITRNGF